MINLENVIPYPPLPGMVGNEITTYELRWGYGYRKYWLLEEYAEYHNQTTEDVTAYIKNEFDQDIKQAHLGNGVYADVINSIAVHELRRIAANKDMQDKYLEIEYGTRDREKEERQAKERDRLLKERRLLVDARNLS